MSPLLLAFLPSSDFSACTLMHTYKDAHTHRKDEKMGRREKGCMVTCMSVPTFTLHSLPLNSAGLLKISMPPADCTYIRKYSSVISPVAKPNIHRQAASIRSLESETVLHGTLLQVTWPGTTQSTITINQPSCMQNSNYLNCD